MGELPAGTATFLFTDIEGSTKHLHELGDAYDSVLADHRDLLRRAFAEHRGVEVGTEGDSFFVAFGSAIDAIRAALAGQQALFAHTWPVGHELRVRMGMHSGEARVVSGDYVGMVVHQAARVSAAAHGGQIVLTQMTRDLVSAELPADTTLLDLGEHTLKDLPKPERIFQVVHRDLPSGFPRLRSLDVRRHNLPVQLTSFIGRDEVKDELTKLLGSSRLVTLTGAGGCGKTRLALEVAADVLEAYADGARLVDLAPVAEHDLVGQAVTSAVGIREQEGRTIESLLEDYFASKQMLLLLDNCEHLVAPCADLVERLLKSSPDLAILVTTREPLGVDGETAWRVPSLRIADEAVKLFIDRAAAADPAFSPSDDDLDAIARICERLDGIPLAIELAAARTEVLSPIQIHERLGDRFKLLTGGKRTALARQQTLRALVDWSYELLDETERTLLGRTSVFSGGFSIEAAEDVCADDSVSSGIMAGEILDVLAQLVRKSLVIADKSSGKVRYQLLETIKQYGREKLLSSPEALAVRGRHRDHFLALAEEAEPHLRGADQAEWLDRLDRDHDNLRTALEWSLAEEEAEAFRLVNALWRFWWMRGYWSEGRRWANQALETGAESGTPLRGRTLFTSSFLAMFQSDNDEATRLANEALALAPSRTDLLAGYALFNLGYIMRPVDRPGSWVCLDESKEIGKAHGDDQLTAWSLCIAGGGEDFERTRRNNKEVLEIARRSGDRWCTAMALGNLAGIAATEDNDIATARTLTEEALTIFRELRDHHGLAAGLIQLAWLEHIDGRTEAAETLAQESLSIAREAGDRSRLVAILPFLGFISSQRGDLEAAVGFSEEAVTVARSTGEPSLIATALNIVSWYAHLSGDNVRGSPMAVEAAELFRSIDDQASLIATLHTIGEIKRALGEDGDAEAALKEAISGASEIGSESLQQACLEGLGGLFASRGDHDRAARFFGAAQQLRDRADAKPNNPDVYERDVARLKDAMDETSLATAWESGRTSPLEESIALALA